MPPAIKLEQLFAGLLFGTAIGDALGLPMENLTAKRIRRCWPGPLRMSFLFGQGMVSDDTEHTFLVAQALLTHPDDPTAFQRCLAWKLRWWFASLPGGLGLATAKACLRLWIGVPPGNSAVVSAGSGAAMRSGIIGAYFADQPEKRREFVRTSTRLTHQSWQAEIAALAIAEAAALAVNGTLGPAAVLAQLRNLSVEQEWQTRIDQLESGLNDGISVSDFAVRLGLERGVTGYALNVVPVAIFAWLRHPNDCRTALTSAIRCGGDTDTIGAILGGLLGASHGPADFPNEWQSRLFEWPRSKHFILRLSQRLADQKNSQTPLGTVAWFWPAQIVRNLIFLAAIVTHVLRRRLPPY